jgi:hypothetical protein
MITIEPTEGLKENDMRCLSASAVVLLCVLLLVPVHTSAQCANGYNNSLLNGRFAFRFDAVVPQPLQNRAIAMRASSVVGQIIYDGSGKVSVIYGGNLTIGPGTIEGSGPVTLSGTYCVNPNGWGTAVLLDSGGNEFWRFRFVAAANWQQLETLTVKTSRPQYALTFSQNKL